MASFWEGLRLMAIAPSQQCLATVWKRDTYRRTGRGKTGFELHFKQCRCQRRTQDESGYCWQHAAYAGQKSAAG